MRDPEDIPVCVEWLLDVLGYVVLCLALLTNSRLRFYTACFCGVLEDVLMGHEVYFQFSSKQPGPDDSGLGVEHWKPETRNHVAFEDSEIQEITFTTIIPRAKELKVPEN